MIPENQFKQVTLPRHTNLTIDCGFELLGIKRFTTKDLRNKAILEYQFVITVINPTPFFKFMFLVQLLFITHVHIV